MMTEDTVRILAFDPGITTGISFLRNGELGFGLTADLESFNQESFLLSLVKMTQPTLIVIEKPPAAARFNMETHQKLFNHIVRWFTVAGFEILVIAPGTWKKLVKRSVIDISHVRDATDMARFVYKTNGGDRL